MAERMTDKIGIAYTPKEWTNYYECCDQLGRLEDLFEKYNIDIEKYLEVKAAKTLFYKIGPCIEKVYVRDSVDSITVYSPGFENIPECDKTLHMKDYGSQFALTREELEHGAAK